MHILLRTVQTTNVNRLVQMYTSYVLPHFDYCSTVWSPHHLGKVRALERVQRTFTRIIHFRCNKINNSVVVPSYSRRIRLLKLDSLFLRRIKQDLTMMYKIIHGKVNMKWQKYFNWVLSRPSRTKEHGYILTSKTSKKDRFIHSFFKRTTKWYSLLPVHVIISPSAFIFRKRLNVINLLEKIKIVQPVF